MSRSSLTLAFSSLLQASRPRTPVRPPKRFICTCPCRRRNFHTSPLRRATKDEDGDAKNDQVEIGDTSKEPPFNPDNISDEDVQRLEKTMAAVAELMEHQTGGSGRELTAEETEAKLEADLTRLLASRRHEGGQIEDLTRPPRTGYIAYGQKEYGIDEDMVGPDEEFAGDDLTELGHAELDRHREMRHYARVAAWEMPLLNKLARPFTPPSTEHVLRFRYTTYLGEEHPGTKKVVCEFTTADLPDLTPGQRVKLVKLVGQRYNPETDVVKMSSEGFETAAQNKRYLGDLVETLLKEARDPKDMFEDVPLDFRHHKFRRFPKFPEAWKLTQERVYQLADERGDRLERQETARIEGRQVDGGKIVEQALAMLSAQQVPVSAAAGGSASGGKGGRLKLR